VTASERAARAGAREDRDVPPSELSYTEATHELEDIVEFFEQREVDVDQLVARLERATAIVDELDRRIHQTRTQVEELVPKLEAVTRAGREATAEDQGTGGARRSDEPQEPGDPDGGEDAPLF
jgi:exodeoxyribonuclease VII small subunit